MIIMPDILLIAHNIRSVHNVGSILRTADGFGVQRIIFSGYTPYPTSSADKRLPHIADKLTRQIHKTALGAEQTVAFTYQAEPDFANLREQGYLIAGLEQSAHSTPLERYRPPDKVALLLGEETAGLTENLIAECDILLEIPMRGTKESFNVSVATGIALYALTTQS